MDKNEKKIKRKSPLEYKVVFLFSLLDIAFNVMLLTTANLRHYFLYSHLVHYSYLYPMLYLKYKKLRYQYYLMDFCYFANALLLTYIWVLPNWPVLGAICFGIGFGILFFSLSFFGNKILFHSVDRMTNTFVHLVPTLCMYLIRFHADDLEKHGGFKYSMDTETMPSYILVFIPVLIYFCQMN